MAAGAGEKASAVSLNAEAFFCLAYFSIMPEMTICWT